MRGFSQRAGCAPQQGLGIAGAALQRWRTDADANTWNIARALCSTTQPPTASKILGPRAARGDAPASSSRQSFSTSVRAAGRRDPPGGSDKDTESDSEAGVDPSEDEESDWSDMEDDDDEEEGEGEGEQVDPGHEIWMTRAEEIAQEAAMRSPSEARHLTTEAVALMTRPLVAAAQAAPDGAAETLWKPRKPIRTPAEVVRHLAETASAGAPVGPWLEHVIAAETTLPPAYEVQLRLSGEFCAQRRANATCAL